VKKGTEIPLLILICWLNLLKKTANFSK